METQVEIVTLEKNLQEGASPASPRRFALVTNVYLPLQRGENLAR